MTRFLNTDLDVTLGGLTPSDEKVSSQKATKTYIDAHKQDIIPDLETIRTNAEAGKSASDTILGYGNIVTHNVSEFATSSQGSKADTAIQPNDNITILNNNAGYITKSVNNLDNYTTTTSLNGLLANKQNKLVAGQNIVIDENTNTISAASQIILDYNDLENKPSINSVELSGNKTLTDLGIQPFGNYAIDTNVVHKTGDETIDGIKTFTQDINGTAIRARWADLAEYYEADTEYAPGTLLQVGGSKEVTLATTECNLVVSTKPGVILNKSKKEGIWVLCALAGRVPLKVDCRVHKADKLYLSYNNEGYASNITNGRCIGIALEDGDKLVNSVVKLSF